MEKKAFVMYQDFWRSVEELSMIDRGRLLTAAYEFHGTGQTTVEIRSGGLKVAWNTLRSTLARDGERYEERCRINAENGKKGGRPRKPKQVEATSKNEDAKSLETIEESSSCKNRTEPKKADIEKEREKEKDIERGMDIGRGGGIKNEVFDSPSPKENSKAAPPPSSSPSSKEREELYRLGVPTSFSSTYWESACEYCKEHTFDKPTDVLYLWWKKMRDGS